MKRKINVFAEVKGDSYLPPSDLADDEIALLTNAGGRWLSELGYYP